MESESGRLGNGRSGDVTLLIPFFFRVSRTETENGDSLRREEATDRESNGISDEIRVVLVDPLNRTFIVLEGLSRFDGLFSETKSEHSPASEASIEAMPEVEVGEDERDLDCAICLEEMKLAKEMPCKHLFHGGCVEKWLRVNGSCPVCRFQMPAEEQPQTKCVDGYDYSNNRGVGVRRDEREIPIPLFAEDSIHNSNQESEQQHRNSD